MPVAQITFWGTRGSTPTIGNDFSILGGETSCVEIIYNDTNIICDAGSGLRRLGEALQRAKCKVDAHLLLSHYHFDHLMGLPFFYPLYQAETALTIYGPGETEKIVKQTLNDLFKPPYLPEVPAEAILRAEFCGISGEVFKIDDIEVRPLVVNHHGLTFGYRFNFPNGKSVAYVPDCEPKGEAEFQKMTAWLQNCDVLIHDAQYTPQEYETKKNWGHSSYSYPLELALSSGVSSVYLFHHDPFRTDKAARELLNDAKECAKGIDVHLAKAGEEIQL